MTQCRDVPREPRERPVERREQTRAAVRGSRRPEKEVGAAREGLYVTHVHAHARPDGHVHGRSVHDRLGERQCVTRLGIAADVKPRALRLASAREHRRARVTSHVCFPARVAKRRQIYGHPERAGESARQRIIHGAILCCHTWRCARFRGIFTEDDKEIKTESQELRWILSSQTEIGIHQFGCNFTTRKK